MYVRIEKRKRKGQHELRSNLLFTKILYKLRENLAIHYLLV